MGKAWACKVVKSARGGDGRFFDFATAGTFATTEAAVEYAAAFAAEQRGVTGARIRVISRRGGKVLHSIILDGARAVGL